jgi:hypothetical protein
MRHSPETDALIDSEADPAEFVRSDINEMIRRLAASIDTVVNPAQDSRIVVAEALMRLAFGVHLFAAGPAATRERLLAMALHTRDARDRVN